MWISEFTLCQRAYDVDLGIHTLPAHALRIASTDTGQSSNFCQGPCTCSLKNHADVRAACGMWACSNAARWLTAHAVSWSVGTF